MSEINVQSLSKRFGYQWIIKDFGAKYHSGKVYGIAGNNGSGKSTLVRMLSGFLTPTTGSINYQIHSKDVSVDQIYKHISLVGPYTDLIQEYSLEEMFNFHQKFKIFFNKLTFQEFEEKINLTGQRHKTIHHLSSGMKQKVQLALALMSDTPIILLDEPTSFLDQKNKDWFIALLHENIRDRIVIIASNDADDLSLCKEILNLSQRN